MPTTTIPAVGDPHTFTERTDYRPYDRRRMDCRSQCTCGTCDGTVTEVTLFVQQVIRWADNSVEVTATDFRGHVWRDTLVYPHGDICY